MFGSLFNNEDFEYPSCYIKKNVNGNGSFNSVERRVISIVFLFRYNDDSRNLYAFLCILEFTLL